MKESTNDNRIEDSFKLELLTPLDKKDDERVVKYLNHINDAIEDSEVKNLALTGVYGSGKSTIIKSYKSKYPNKEFLNISLAAFNETGDYDKFKDQIQLAILQQIIYSQNSDRLQDSRINRIREINIWNINHILKVLVLLGFLVSTFSILKFFTFQINPNNWDTSLDFDWWCFLTVIVFLISSFFIIQFVVKILSNSKINKVNVKGEIGIADGIEHKDFLNKYIDEILYFFEKISIDVVVIEDLDRFNNTEIFRTLREINFVLNNYLKNTKGKDYKKVVFLYAIKDELFSSELERTKFFDLIIPTIPYVNYSNSKNVLKSKLDEIYNQGKELKKDRKSSELKRYRVSKDFINTVSAFITDNRILLNIINEFFVFKEQQSILKEEFNQEKLLAIVIYKNLRPKDFSRLHKSVSNIDVVFSNQGRLIQNSINSFQNEINKLENEISKIKYENLESITELNTIFIYHIKEAINNSSARKLVINSEEKTFKLLIDEGIDLSPLYTDKIKYLEQYYSASNSIDENLNDIDNLVGYKYSEKYDTILNKNKLIEEKENEVKEIENSIVEIQTQSMSQILKDKVLTKENLMTEFASLYSNSSIPEKERVYNDALLIFLLENSYIDEHYRDYISTFQKGGLTEGDQEFKINIISRFNEPKPFDYELINKIEILEELPINYFKEDRILNVSLLDFLIVKKDNYTEKFEALLKTISKWKSKRTKQFFNLYINHSGQKEQFVIELSKDWKNLWNKVQSDTSYLEKDKKQLLFLTINNLDDETLISQNKQEALSNYISSDVMLFYNHNFLVDLERIEEIFSKVVLNVKFEELIPIGDKYDEKYELIIKQDSYHLNYNNIGIILEHQLDENFDKGQFDKSNLSYIYGSAINELIVYIEEDSYNSYIQNVYPKLDNRQNEDEENILMVLNKKGLEKNNAITFLKKQVNKISDLDDLENVDHFNLVFEYNAIEPEWDNIYKYYYEKDNTLDETLIQFLNSEENYSNLSISKIDVNDNEKINNEFIGKLITNNEISIASYSVLMQSVPVDFELSEGFDFKLINKGKVEVLIEESIVKLNQSTFDSIKDIHPELHINLLERNELDYRKYINENELKTEDKVLIIQSWNLSDVNKLKLINYITIDELKDSEELSEEVVDLILNTKSKSLSKENIKTVLSQDLTTEQKVNLIVLYQSIFSKTEIVDLLNNYLPDSYQISPRTQIMLDNSSYNESLLGMLQQKGIAGKSGVNKNKQIRIWLNDYTK